MEKARQDTLGKLPARMDVPVRLGPESVLGKDIIVHGFTPDNDAKFADTVIVDYETIVNDEPSGEHGEFFTSSAILREQLERTSNGQGFPVVSTVKEAVSRSGQTYFTFSS